MTAVVGFDVEWRVTYESGAAPLKVATVQLATAHLGNALAIVAHVSQTKSVPKCLVDFLARRDIAKVGVRAPCDAHKLQWDYPGTLVNSCFDVNHLATTVGVQSGSLAHLAAKTLRARLDKPQDLRCGDWERFPLSEAQRQYAALDAWASFKVFRHLASLHAGAGLLEACAAPRVPDVPKKVEGGVSAEPLCVPKALWATPLANSRQSALDLFLTGQSFDDICGNRGIKWSTGINYLTDAIDQGHAYDWRLFQIAFGANLKAVLEKVEKGATAKEIFEETAVDYNVIKIAQAHHKRVSPAAESVQECL
ncbi:ribonuclease H-like domain-containing protein [Pelagophyceae sp. CCMP2097]|nr:ribonuclease H-like domain-containing protein [Pelagophyceae sp. CCMP2097]